jgi:hypothetical protein
MYKCLSLQVLVLVVAAELQAMVVVAVAQVDLSTTLR